MTTANPVTDEMLAALKIEVREPFAEFLKGTEAESRFAISLLDTVRFAGHACPAMVGAFFTARAAIRELFPDDHVCIRGSIEISLPGGAHEGATGPVSNVLSFITGAWGETGFGGLKGRFGRRDLLHYGVRGMPLDAIRFRRTDSGAKAYVRYRIKDVMSSAEPQPEFQWQWRQAVRSLIDHPERYIDVLSRP